MSRQIVMGVDVGTHSVKTVIAHKKEGEIFPSVLGTGISPSHGIRRGYVINLHDVTTSIKNSVRKAENAAKMEIKKAFISAGAVGIEGIRSKGSIAVSRADREITENDLKRALNQSEIQLSRGTSSYLLNREILHNFPLFYKVDDEIIIGSPVGMKGEKLETEALFITSPSQHLNSLVKSAEMAGLSVEDIFADTWATSHTILNTQEKEVGCLLVNIGGDTSSIMVFEEGSPISLEVLSIGSNHITFDIAQGFQILLDEAEQLKLSYGSDASMGKKLSNIIEPRLNDIFELIEGHLNKIKRSKLLPAGIIITGGGANLNNIDETARNILRLPVQLGKARCLNNENDLTDNPAWSVALGICTAALTNTENNPINPEKGLTRKIKKATIQLFKHILP